MKLLLTAALLFSSFFATSCKKNNLISPDSQSQVNLTLIEFASTEVWLKVETKNISLPAHFYLLVNDSINRPVFMEESENKLYINDLLPNYNYKFKVTQDVKYPIESNNVDIKTLDTTSNEITWQTYEFSEKTTGGANLSSICVENDLSVWGAGEYYMLDSLGQFDSEPYGLVNWDGNKLNYFKVYCKDFGYEHYSPSIITCVFETAGELYSTSISQLLRLENNTWQQVADFMLDQYFDKNILNVGGTGPDNLYCSGFYGGIFHVTSQGWTEVNSQTSNQFLDLISYIDPEKGDKVSLFVSSDWQLTMHYITKIVDNLVTDTIPIGVEYYYSVWTKRGFPIFVCGPGVIDNKNIYFSIVLPSEASFTGIRGNDLNDIFTCNVIGQVFHFNGSYWKLFNNFNGIYIFYEISVKENTIALMGENNENGKPVIVIGKRN